MNAMTYPGQTDQRLLWWCVGGSLCLHAMMLWQAHGVSPAPPAPPQITASIRPVAPPVPLPQAQTAPPQAEPAKPEVKPEPKPEPKPEVKPTPAPPPKAATPDRPAPKATAAEPKAAAQPATPAPAAAQPAPSTPAPAAEPAKSAPSPAPAPAAPAASAGAMDMDDLALVRNYQLQLAQVTEKYKVYPAVAMENRWEGSVLVRVRIGADGRTQGVDVVTSSGHEMLDERARDAVSKAKPRVQTPERLRGKEFVAEVRVIYDLKK